MISNTFYGCIACGVITIAVGAWIVLREYPSVLNTFIKVTNIEMKKDREAIEEVVKAQKANKAKRGYRIL